MLGLGVEYGQQGGNTRHAVRHGAVQELGEVIEVGQIAIAVGGAEHPCHHAGIGPHPSQHVCDGMAGEQCRPVRQLLL